MGTATARQANRASFRCEQSAAPGHLVGKILRIIPDLNEHATRASSAKTAALPVPKDNPFVDTPGAQGDLGIRIPQSASPELGHRPTIPRTTASSRTQWGCTRETVNIVHKGGNHGYPQREGNEALKLDNTTGPIPVVDKIPVQIGDEVTDKVVIPLYPVIQYGHVPTGGDAIGSGFVYNGKNFPALRGKYIFTDITTGHIWWADYKEMLAADDGNPGTLAKFHEVKILWDNPNDADAENSEHHVSNQLDDLPISRRQGRTPGQPSDHRESGRGTIGSRWTATGAYLYSRATHDPAGGGRP
jgi:hypothetical protein